MHITLVFTKIKGSNVLASLRRVFTRYECMLHYKKCGGSAEVVTLLAVQIVFGDRGFESQDEHDLSKKSTGRTSKSIQSIKNSSQ